MEKYVTVEAVIKELENHYRETGMARSMEYTYGYMDAMAALRELAKKPQANRDALKP